jgi:hypothetical protein
MHRLRMTFLTIGRTANLFGMPYRATLTRDGVLLSIRALKECRHYYTD